MWLRFANNENIHLETMTWPLAFFVTCQPVEDVWEHGSAGHKGRSSSGDFEKDELDRKKKNKGLLFTSSALSNAEYKRFAWVHPADSFAGPGICNAPYPSQQLTYEESLVPDFVWLVLLDKSQLRKNSKCLLSRHREEDDWSEKGDAGSWNVPATRPVIPLLCTANANFRRPYKPRLRHHNITITTTISTLVADANVDQMYHVAYSQMKDALLKSMASS